jgi:hypothetical protein
LDLRADVRTGRAAPDVTAETYVAILRGIKRAGRRINADKRRYASYFLRDCPDQSEVTGAPGPRTSTSIASA